MDLQEYYKNIRKEEARLKEEFGTRTIYVMSVKNSSKNTLPGKVHAASHYNAARVLVDETHRLATEDEVRGYLDHQEDCRQEALRSEARKKKEVVVVMDRGGHSSSFPEGSEGLVEDALAAAGSGSRRRPRGVTATAE